MPGLQDGVLHPVPRGCGGQEEWVGARTPATDLPSARSMLRRICSASVCLERPIRSQTLRVGGPTPARHALGHIGAVAGRALRAPQTGPERPAINPRYRPRAWLQPSPGPLLTTHHLLAQHLICLPRTQGQPQRTDAVPCETSPPHDLLPPLRPTVATAVHPWTACHHNTGSLGSYQQCIILGGVPSGTAPQNLHTAPPWTTARNHCCLTPPRARPHALAGRAPPRQCPKRPILAIGRDLCGEHLSKTPKASTSFTHFGCLATSTRARPAVQFGGRSDQEHSGICQYQSCQ